MARIEWNKEQLQNIMSNLSKEQIKLNDLNQKNGASIWLTAQTQKNERYVLANQLFWYLIPVRHRWQLSRVSEVCECGANFSLHHALSCKKEIYFHQTQKHSRSNCQSFEGSMSRCSIGSKTPIFNWIKVRRKQL